MQKRMGRYVKQDQAMDVKILREMLKRYEQELLGHGLTEECRRKIYMCGFTPRLFEEEKYF